jgi:hypothetical protein
LVFSASKNGPWTTLDDADEKGVPKDALVPLMIARQAEGCATTIGIDIVGFTRLAPVVPVFGRRVAWPFLQLW